MTQVNNLIYCKRNATEELINKRGAEEEFFWVKEVKRTMTQFLKLDTRLCNAK